MTYTPKILAFAGSTRVESYNKKLAKIAANGAKAAGAEITYIDLRDIPMPLYDEDLEREEGIPANARKFKELMLQHQGLLIASPEYNSSISAVLKNAIDWASRPEPGQEMLACFTNKVAALMSASPGGFGGVRGLSHLRSLLGSIRVTLIPDQVIVPGAMDAFNTDGTLKDSTLHQSVEGLGHSVANILKKLNA